MTKRNIIKVSILLLTNIALSWPAVGQGKPKKITKRDAAVLLENAAAATRLTSVAGIHYRLFAEITYFDRDMGPQGGTFLKLGLGAKRRREELKMPTFAEIQVMDVTKLWVSRTAPQKPAWFIRVGYFLVRAFAELRLDPRDSIGKIVQSKASEGDQTCVEFGGVGGPRRWVCLNTNQLPGEIRTTFPEGRYQYLDYAPFAKLSIPRLIRYSRGNRVMLEVRVKELTEFVDTADALTPPAGAVAREWCADMSFVRSTGGPVILPTLQGVSPLANWWFLLHALRGKDGHLRDVILVDKGGTTLDSPTITQFLGMSEGKAICDGHPIELETELLFSSLGQ